MPFTKFLLFHLIFSLNLSSAGWTAPQFIELLTNSWDFFAKGIVSSAVPPTVSEQQAGNGHS